MWHCADLCMRSQDMKLNSHRDRFSLPPSYVTPHVFTCSVMGARSSCQEASYKPRNVCTVSEGHISNLLILSYVHSIFQSWKKIKGNRWIEQTMTFSSRCTNNALQLPEFTAMKTKPQGMHNKSRWRGLCSTHKINLTLDMIYSESQQICQSFHALLSFA